MRNHLSKLGLDSITPNQAYQDYEYQELNLQFLTDCEEEAAMMSAAQDAAPLFSLHQLCGSFWLAVSNANYPQDFKTQNLELTTIEGISRAELLEPNVLCFQSTLDAEKIRYNLIKAHLPKDFEFIEAEDLPI